jgi:hypothetical protein
MRRPLVLFLLLSAAACAMPSTVVQTPETRPSLAIEGAPAGAILFLDGVQVGEANRYDGQPGVLRVDPGTHTVTIRGGDGSDLLEQKIFVESERKTIKVR